MRWKRYHLEMWTNKILLRIDLIPTIFSVRSNTSIFHPLHRCYEIEIIPRALIIIRCNGFRCLSGDVRILINFKVVNRWNANSSCGTPRIECLNSNYVHVFCIWLENNKGYNVIFWSGYHWQIGFIIWDYEKQIISVRLVYLSKWLDIHQWSYLNNPKNSL